MVCDTYLSLSICHFKAHRMSRLTPTHELDSLVELIGTSPDGVGIDTIAQQLGISAGRVVTGRELDAVTDEEVVEGIKLLAQTEGIFAETAGGVTIGVLCKLVKQGLIKKSDVTVAYITGNGLKTQEAVVDAVGRPFRIQPSLVNFQKTFKMGKNSGGDS